MLQKLIIIGASIRSSLYVRSIWRSQRSWQRDLSLFNIRFVKQQGWNNSKSVASVKWNTASVNYSRLLFVSTDSRMDADYSRHQEWKG